MQKFSTKYCIFLLSGGFFAVFPVFRLQKTQKKYNLSLQKKKPVLYYDSVAPERVLTRMLENQIRRLVRVKKLKKIQI